jgi:hypothetical protein
MGLYIRRVVISYGVIHRCRIGAVMEACTARGAVLRKKSSMLPRLLGTPPISSAFRARVPAPLPKKIKLTSTFVFETSVFVEKDIHRNSNLLFSKSRMLPVEAPKHASSSGHAEEGVRVIDRYARNPKGSNPGLGAYKFFGMT